MLKMHCSLSLWRCCCVLTLIFVQLVHVYVQGSCIHSEDDSPKCEIIDILRLMDDDQPSSFDCISQYANTIHLRHGGEISLECHAPYPIDLRYDSVLPAHHFDLSFYKKVETQEPESGPGEKNFNLDSINVTYYVTVFLDGTHIPWAANYVFKGLAGMGSKRTRVSVFIEKNFPLFLSEKDDDVPLAPFDEAKEHVILPCRTQKWNSTVQLFSPDFEELTDGTFDDLVKFDPRVGFTIKWDADRIPVGQYRCMTQLGEENDEMKVNVVAPDDYSEPEPKVETNVEGTITFGMAGDDHVARCKVPKRLPAKVFGLVNVRSKNPTTTRYTHGCLEPDVTCENRKTGATTDTGFYEIKPVYRSGLLKCSDKQTLDYFLGADNRIYHKLEEARNKNALVVVRPSSKDKKHYFPKETYEMTCYLAKYHSVKPIFWSVHYKNETQLQFFEPSKETMDLHMTEDVIGISCGASLWNSEQWHTSYLPIKAAHTSAPEVSDNVTNFVFELGSVNRVLRCKAWGIPKPTLKWLRNGNEVDSSLAVQSETDADELVLLFPRVKTEDEGEYFCAASNSLGDTEVVFTVQVMEVDFTPELLPPPPAISFSLSSNTQCTNTTTTISKTKIITFFQFQPVRSDGQITVPVRDKIRPGDVLYLFIPNINSRFPERMPEGMNLTVRVLGMESNEELPGDYSAEPLTSATTWAVILAIIVICIILLLIIVCGICYC